MISQVYNSSRHPFYFSEIKKSALSRTFSRGIKSSFAAPYLASFPSKNSLTCLEQRTFSTLPHPIYSTKYKSLFHSTFPLTQQVLRMENFRPFSIYSAYNLLNLKIDTVFKEFFGDPENKEIVESFINLFLDLKGKDEIEIEAFSDSSKLQLKVGKPTTFIDLSVKTKGGERYIIQLQTYNFAGFEKTLLERLAKNGNEPLLPTLETFKQKQEPHILKHPLSGENVPKVHIIAITSYSVVKLDNIVKTFRFLPQNRDNDINLFDQWRATIIDLTKFQERSFDEVESERDQWLFLMKNTELLNDAQIERIKTQKPILKRVLEHLEKSSSSPKMRKEYEQSMDEIRDWNAILDYRYKKSAFKIAKKMLQNKLPIEEIAQLTGLSKKDVKDLQK